MVKFSKITFINSKRIAFCRATLFFIAVLLWFSVNIYLLKTKFILFNVNILGINEVISNILIITLINALIYFFAFYNLKIILGKQWMTLKNMVILTVAVNLLILLLIMYFVPEIKGIDFHKIICIAFLAAVYILLSLFAFTKKQNIYFNFLMTLSFPITYVSMLITIYFITGFYSPESNRYVFLSQFLFFSFYQFTSISAFISYILPSELTLKQSRNKVLLYIGFLAFLIWCVVLQNVYVPLKVLIF